MDQVFEYLLRLLNDSGLSYDDKRALLVRLNEAIKEGGEIDPQTIIDMPEPNRQAFLIQKPRPALNKLYLYFRPNAHPEELPLDFLCMCISAAAQSPQKV